jgi:citrate/tricarballylate utilization protein
VTRFWVDTGGGSVSIGALLTAAKDAATLKNLGGGGPGCNDIDESFSAERRWFHHSMFYGFLLCFASTTIAAVYDHFLGRIAPYQLSSAPVVLGTVGGIGMTIGALGLLRIKVIADPLPASRALMKGEYAFLAQLILVALTGLALLPLRETRAMALLLTVHLGVVLSIFLTMPYGKFVHGIYRSAALVRNARERTAAPVSAVVGLHGIQRANQ